MAFVILTLASLQVQSASMMLYIYKDNQPALNTGIKVDNKEVQLPNDIGQIELSIESGQHLVTLVNDKKIALLQFPLDTNNKDFVDVRVSINKESKPEILIEQYDKNTTSNDALGYLVGEIKNNDQIPINNATITVSSGATTQTDETGYFELQLPRGFYDINIDHPSYGESQINDVRIVAFVDKNIDITLTDGEQNIEQVEVLGTFKANQFVDKERFAVNVVDVLDAEAMARFGDSSAGDALKRIAGVSVSGNKYAIIRGLQGRFIATALNQGTIPSLNPTRRDIALDIFPASILGGLEIEKSYRPELPGNTTGGLINIVTKKPEQEYTHQLSGGLGFVSGVTGNDVVSYKGGKTDWLGYDDGIRQMPSSIDNASNFGSPGTSSQIRNLGQDFEPIYDIKTQSATPNYNIGYNYGNYLDLTAGTLSYYGSVDFSSQWKSRQDAKINDKIGNGVYNYQRSTAETQLSGYLALAYEDETGNNSYNSKTIYLHQSSDTTRVDIGVDDEENNLKKYLLEWIENTYIAQQFSGSHAFADQSQKINWFLGVSQTQRIEPDRRAFQDFGGAPLISSLERRFGDMTENAIDLGINYQLEFDIADFATTTFKTGVYTEQKDRNALIGRFGFSAFDINTIGQTFESVLSPENFAQGLITTRVNTTKNDNYDAKNTINAVYVSTETTFLDDWDLLAGVRYEMSEQQLNYPNNPVINNNYDTTDFLPVISITYRLDESWQLRGSLSQTVSRPGMTERAESKFYDPETDDLFFGNSDLESSTIQNIDLRTEYQFDDQNNVSIALFSKAIDSPIEISKFSCSGSACDGYSFVNQDNATLYGLEIDFAAILFDLSDWQAFTRGNLSYIDSSVTLTQKAQNSEYKNPKTRQLQGQSDYLANLQIGLDHFATEQAFSLSANYFSDRIFRVENTQPNKIEKGQFKLNFVYQWQLNETIEVKAKVNNILNTPTKYARDEGDVIESYSEGTGFNLGLNINF